MFYVKYQTLQSLIERCSVIGEQDLNCVFPECIVVQADAKIAISIPGAKFFRKNQKKSLQNSVRCCTINLQSGDYPIALEEIIQRYRGVSMSDMRIIESHDDKASYTDDALFNISTWGADMSFREIIFMYDDDELIKPELQRKYVWSKDEASRFIDSLLLGLPVPSIFFAKVGENRLIIDGYQRIMTVYDFVKGVFSGDRKVFSLSNSEAIYEKWRGKSYSELSADERKRINNYLIHAIIFEQKRPCDDTGMYQIFERINSSGRTLKPQEIRNCVYHGPFNTVLMELNKIADWRVLFGSEDEDSRMADVELILRFFALCDLRRNHYSLYDARKGGYEDVKQIQLKKYLNEYMGRMNNADAATLSGCSELFSETFAFIRKTIGKNAFRNLRGISATRPVQQYATAFHPALFDAVAQAAALCVENGTASIPHELTDYEKRHRELLKTEDFRDCISVRTTNIDRIQRRISLAYEKLFLDVT